MKFELAEMVPVKDPQEVLRVLEPYLRVVAADVVLTNGQITAYGIGPSPRVLNRRDTTVIDASSLDGSTQLIATVTYQASALLGNSPQDSIVRAKIEKAIHEMRSELKVPREWVQAEESSYEAGAVEETAQLEPAHLRFKDEDTSMGEPESSWLPFRDAPMPDVVEMPRLVASIVSQEGSDTALEPATTPMLKPLVQALPAVNQRVPEVMFYSDEERRTGPQRPINKSNGLTATEIERRRIAPLDELPLLGLLRTQLIENDEPSGRRKTIAAIAASIVLLAGIAGYVLRDRLPTPKYMKPTLTVWSKETANSTPPLEGKNPSSTVPAPVGEPSPDARSAQAKESNPLIISAPKLAVKPEKTVYAWAQHWAAAQRSRDPIAQASYYADPVDKYMRQPGISRESVMQDKTANILGRGPAWSMTVDHINVVNQGPSVARVRMVKHLVSKTPKGRLVTTVVQVRMKLIRVGGMWKIVDEQEGELS